MCREDVALHGVSSAGSTQELVMIFIGLEISSISTYILAGYRRNDPRSAEAALKYFLLGSFATAFLLYGIALVFGATGSTYLPNIRRALDQGASPLVGVATALMFVGLGFKVAAAPFEVWTPDVYQGAPTPITALLSVGPKAAAFAVFLRVFLSGLAPAEEVPGRPEAREFSAYNGELLLIVEKNVIEVVFFIPDCLRMMKKAHGCSDGGEVGLSCGTFHVQAMLYAKTRDYQCQLRRKGQVLEFLRTRLGQQSVVGSLQDHRPGRSRSLVPHDARRGASRARRTASLPLGCAAPQQKCFSHDKRQACRTWAGSSRAARLKPHLPRACTNAAFRCPSSAASVASPYDQFRSEPGPASDLSISPPATRRESGVGCNRVLGGPKEHGAFLMRDSILVATSKIGFERL